MTTYLFKAEAKAAKQMAAAVDAAAEEVAAGLQASGAVTRLKLLEFFAKNEEVRLSSYLSVYRTRYIDKIDREIER